MSGQPNIYAMDQAKFRQQYLSNLNLQANIDDKNLQANKIYKKTGSTPTQLTDTRTTAEKLLDIERLKIDVRSELSKIADGTNAGQIVEQLDPATLSFLAQHIDEVVKEIKPKYKYGVPADVFIPFIQAYMNKAITTNEVSFGLQQSMGRNILLGIQQIQNQMVRVGDLDNLRTMIDRVQREMVRPADLRTLRGEVNADNVAVAQRLRGTINADLRRLRDEIGADMVLNIRVGNLNRLTVADLNALRREIEGDIRAANAGRLTQADLDALSQRLRGNINADLQRVQRGIAGDIDATMQQVGINQNLIQAVLRNIDDMRRIIPTTSEIQEIGRVQNEGLKAEITAELSDAIEPLPTRAQIQQMMQQLETAIETSDTINLEVILEKINDVISLQPATSVQLTEIKKQLEDISAVKASSSEVGGAEAKKVSKVSKAKEAGISEAEPVEAISVAKAISGNKGGPAGLTPEVINEYRSRFIASTNFPEGPEGKQQMAKYVKDLLGKLPIGIPRQKENYGISKTTTLGQASRETLENAILQLNTLIGPSLFPEGIPADKKGSSSSGYGIKKHKMKGEGISKGILDKVDYTNGIISKNKFVPFGKFFIDTNRLNDNIISVKRGKGINVSGLPVQRVSNELGSVMRTIVGNGQPQYNEIEKLTDDEKKYLYKISKTTNILNKLSIPTPNKDDDEKDINQFEIYKGELLNGNDSSELIKKFKLLIVKMVKRDLLPKGQANEILMDMATLGY